MTKIHCCALVTCLFLLSGCRTRYKLEPSVAGNSAVISFDQKSPRGYAILLLRYPIGFTEKATAQLQSIYDSSPDVIWQKAPGNASDFFSETLLRNFYLTIDFQRAIEKRLGKGSVVLWPYVLDVNSSGVLIEKDDIVPPPHVLNVQLAVNIAGIRLFKNAIAFGDCFGRLVNVDCIASLPETSVAGLSSQILGSTVQGKGAQAPWPAKLSEKEYPATIGYLQSYGRLEKAGEMPGVKARPLNRKRPAQVNCLNVFTPGYYNYEADIKSIRAQADQTPTAGNSAFSILWDLYANSLIEMLNQIDMQQTASSTVKNYATNALLLPNFPTDLKLFNELIEAEISFLTEQDEAFVKLMYEGEFGQSYRKQLVAETEVEERQMEAANMAALQNLAASAALLGAVASAPPGQAPSTAVSTQSLQTFLTTEQRQNQLRYETFSPLKRNFSEINKSQQVFVHKLGGGEKEIRANNLSEFRNEAHEIVMAPQ